MIEPTAAIVGIGQTDCWRGSGRSAQSMAAEAISAALSDSGLDRATIDGLLPYVPGVTAEEVLSAFGWPKLSYVAFHPSGGAFAVASLRNAAIALGAGAAKYIVLFMATAQSTNREHFRSHSGVPGQEFRVEFEHPYGWSRPAHWYAMIAQRHMHIFGTTKAQMAQVAMTMRDNAQRNPSAYTYGRTLSYEEYFTAQTVADPYQKFDCCLETDGAAAIILTTPERAKGSAKRSVLIAGAESAFPYPADDILGRSNLFDIGLTHAAPLAFAQAGITPTEVDAAMIYDCFTFEVIHQLEEAGFCERGEGGAFVESGAISMEGALPVNPHGGLLSEGHIAGMNHIVEAVRQIRGEAGARQLARAEQIVVTGWGTLGNGALAVLRGGDRR